MYRIQLKNKQGAYLEAFTGETTKEVVESAVNSYNEPENIIVEMSDDNMDTITIKSEGTETLVDWKAHEEL